MHSVQGRILQIPSRSPRRIRTAQSSHEPGPTRQKVLETLGPRNTRQKKKETNLLFLRMSSSKFTPPLKGKRKVAILTKEDSDMPVGDLQYARNPHARNCGMEPIMIQSCKVTKLPSDRPTKTLTKNLSLLPQHPSKQANRPVIRSREKRKQRLRGGYPLPGC